MRLDTKFKVFFTVFAVGGLLGEAALYYWLDPSGGGDVNREVVAFVVVWALAFGVMQRRLLRCPNCRKHALVPPGTVGLQRPGRRCKYCGLDY